MFVGYLIFIRNLNNLHDRLKTRYSHMMFRDDWTVILWLHNSSSTCLMAVKRLEWHIAGNIPEKKQHLKDVYDIFSSKIYVIDQESYSGHIWLLWFGQVDRSR